MAYLCPVCEEPFADSQGCTNHLAVAAVLHGGDHESWLTETVEAAAGESADSWESIRRADLAELVADRAEKTADHEHPADHNHPGAHTHPPDHMQQPDQTPADPLDQTAITEPAGIERLDADGQAILREARELTKQMARRGADESEES